jgi:hypothetical protein
VGTNSTVAPTQPTVPAVPAVPAARTRAVRETVGTSGILPTPRRTATTPLVTLRPPESNDGVWIQYAGAKWVSAGDAVPFTATGFQYVGEYATYPVFARTADRNFVYLPTSRAGYVAPYRLKDSAR